MYQELLDTDSGANWTKVANSLDEMRQIANQLARHVAPGQVLYFEGGLGSGKTTLIQGICQALGVDDPVLSPTFSILKPYTSASGLELVHLDLYRIQNPAELLLIGIEDYLDTNHAWLIEWPEYGFDVIPDPDIRINLHHEGAGRRVCANIGGFLR